MCCSELEKTLWLQAYRRKEPLAWASGRWYDVNGALNLPKVRKSQNSRSLAWILLTSKMLKDVDILWQFSQSNAISCYLKSAISCGHTQAICEKRKVAGICDTGWKAHEDSCYFKCLGAKA